MVKAPSKLACSSQRRLFSKRVVPSSKKADTNPEPEHIIKIATILSKLHSKDEDDILEALKAFVDCFEKCDSCKDLPKLQKSADLACATLVVISQPMKKWPTHEQIQGWCCQCLITLSCWDDEGRIAQLQGVYAIFLAMKQFPDSSWIQQTGAHALMNIFDDLLQDSPPEKVLEDSRHFVRELNGLKLIEKAMQNSWFNAVLQEACCGLYMNLSTRKEFRDALEEEGAAVAVATTLRHHNRNADIARYARPFMRFMYVDDDGDEGMAHQSYRGITNVNKRIGKRGEGREWTISHSTSLVPNGCMWKELFDFGTSPSLNPESQQ